MPSDISSELIDKDIILKLNDLVTHLEKLI